jgi:hypothetical protein
MDRIDQDLNRYQADLDAREQRVEELKACPLFKARLFSVCEDLLEDDPCQPECIQAVDYVCNAFLRAKADLIEGNPALYASLKKHNERMTVNHMVDMAIKHENRIFEIVIGEFM